MDFYWQRGAQSIESIAQALFKRNVPNFVKCLVRVWRGESAHIFHMQVQYRGGDVEMQGKICLGRIFTL